MRFDLLKELNISLHVIATGAAAGLQNELWKLPGSSSYLSGGSFPYATKEQEELLGFLPDHFCSEEAAVDLASVAYMKAFSFGEKKPVGLGLTASVASEKIHRGDHRVFVCAMTDDKVLSGHLTLTKGVGIEKRKFDGNMCEVVAVDVLADVLGVDLLDLQGKLNHQLHDATELAKSRFFMRPFFSANGKREEDLPPSKRWALMSGAFNPPHAGHFGVASHLWEDAGRKVVFEITAEPPHKEALSVQELLKRAKNLQGHDCIFTRQEALYLDKARAFPKVPLVMGADAAIRLLDPKWGVDPVDLFEEFKELGTTLYICGRTVNGKFTTRDDILEGTSPELHGLFDLLTQPVDGHWDISSSEIRDKMV